jgi:hypothetical protein
MTRYIVLLLCCLALVANPVLADQESRNWIRVTASVTDGTAYHGDRYAKSIPDEDSGTKGRTRIYRVGRDEDTLEHEFDWYAITVHLCGTSDGTSVVRMGPWNRGGEPKKDDLALAFYFAGNLVHSYSTLDIALKPQNVQASVSHYQWAKRVHGYCWLQGPGGQRKGFALETMDGRTLSFDMKTGELLKEWKPVRAEE